MSREKTVSGIPAGLKCETRCSCQYYKWENLLAFVPVLNCYLLLTDVNDERSHL
jgi:hypothetical protein